MSRQLNKLTALAVKKVRYDENSSNKYTDGAGLYLLVDKSGGKYWRMDYRRPVSGKRNTLALGVYDTVTLEIARTKRDEVRRSLDQGIDPAEQREQKKQNALIEKINTFELLARDWLAIRAHEQKDDHENKRRLERDVFPYIGDKPLSSLTTTMLEKNVTDRIVERGSLETAVRVRMVIRMILQLAKKRKLISDNPAEDMTLPRPIKGNHAAIVDQAKIIGLVKDVWAYQERPRVNVCTASALKLSMLIFLRPSEIRMLKWSSFIREDQILEIKAAKQKREETPKTHIVPLSRQALEILNSLFPITGQTEYIFFSSTGNEPYLSEGTVNMALIRLGYKGKQTAHGLRATARTVLDERLGFRPDWIEHQLAHAVKDPNGVAYNRTKHFEQRKEMMQAWSDYLDELRRQ
jgi:integrase